MRSRRTPGASLLLSLLLFALSPFHLQAGDLDRDGIDDAFEETVARAFLPMIWYRATEACAEPGVILFHVRPYVPGGSADTLSITYSMAYYEDCGSLGHDFDLETFALTLYPLGTGPLGYGVHAVRAWAHRGSLICESEEDRTYDPPRPNVPAAGDTLYASWGNIYAAGGKHGLYLNESTCDSSCLGTDWCDRDRLLNGGRLVPEWQGQHFDMYNIGEINDPLIEDFSEIDLAGGHAFGARPLWDSTWMVEAFYAVAPGPSLPAAVSIRSTYDDPLAVCGEQSVSFSLPYRALVRSSVYALSGTLLAGRYLGEFCASDTVMAVSWDGLDDDGECVPPGNYYLVLEAHRAGDGASDTERFGVAFDAGPHPAAPTDLRAALDGERVALTWTDNADDEDGFVVERRTGSCAFARIALAGAAPGTGGDVAFVDESVDPGDVYGYRVFAYRTFAGYSGYSDGASIEIPECADSAQAIVDGPTLHADTVYADHAYAVDVQTLDPECPFVGYEWTVLGNDWTEPGTISGSGDQVIYVAPAAPAAGRDYPELQNRIDLVTTCGGEADSATTGWFTITLAPPPDSSGCPVLHVPVNGQFRAENNLLPFSEISPTDRTDYYRLRATPDLVNGRYVLEIREDGREHSDLDAVELRVVDHEPAVRIGVTSDGTTFGYRETTPPVRSDGRRLRFDPPGSRFLIVNLPPTPEVKSFGPAFRADDPGSITPPGAIGGGLCLPRHRGGEQAIDLGPDADPGSGRDVRVDGLGARQIERIGLATGLTRAFDVTRIPPQEAVHTARGDVTDLLLDVDGQPAELRPGEAIRLSFPAPDGPPGAARDFILVVTGHYER